VIKRKCIYLGDPYAADVPQPPSKRHKPDTSSCTLTATTDEDSSAVDTTVAADAADAGAGSSSPPDSPKGVLQGVVLETLHVAQKDQVYVPDDHLTVLLDSLQCQICGADDNEELLLICDGEN
jgi:hypothetical protein